MTLNFDFLLKDLGGKDIPEAHAGKMLANELSSDNKGNSIKLFDWALKLWNSDALVVDSVDADVLEKTIESTQKMTNLAKAQLLGVIKAAKEDKEATKVESALKKSK